MSSKVKTSKKKREIANGIFCLEGEWDRNLKRPSTVRPILELLNAQPPYPPFIHRGIGTREEFDYYLDRWTQKAYDGYPILYVATHGNEGSICLTDHRKKSDNHTLQSLGKKLEGKCAGRIIHLGGCETLLDHGKRIKTFLNVTEAIAVTGFKSYVEWVDSTVFELLLFEELQRKKITRAVANKLEQKLNARARTLLKNLDFRIVVRD